MRFFSCCALLMLAASSYAQECKDTLAGQVRDSYSNEAVPFARVSIPELELQQTADSSGSFYFSGLCSGAITLRCIPHFGCDPVDLVVVLPLTERLVFNVDTHVVEELDKARIVAYVFRKESQERFKVETLDLSRIKGNTLGEQLERVPGVTTLNTGSSIVKPVINGMHSNRIVVVNNGIRQEGQQWGSEHAPEIDPNLASNLEVIQGAAGLQYGPDAIGGVILVNPEKLRYAKPLSGWVKSSVNSNGRGAMLSGLMAGSLFKSGRIAYRVHGTGRVNGTQHTPDYLVRNTTVKEYSFSGALGYKGTRLEADVFYSLFATHLGIFTGSHIGNLTDLNDAFQDKQPKDIGTFTYDIENPKQFVQHQVSRAYVGYSWTEKVKSQLLVGYQYNLRQEYDNHKSYNDSIEALGLPDFELNLWTTSADLKTVITHSKAFKSTVGVAGFKQANAYSGRFFIPNFQKWQGGAYYTGVYETAYWQLEGGVRYDVSKLQVYMYEGNTFVTPVRKFANFSSSFGASRIIGHHWIAKLNAGTSWRPPSINELFSNGLHHGAASIEVGDSQLKEETVYHAQAGAQYKSRLAKLDVSVFFNRFDGFINLQPVLPPQLTIVGAFPVFHYRQSAVELSGINGQLEIPVRKWLTYAFQGSVLYALETKSRQPVYGIPSNRFTNRLRAEAGWKKTNWLWFAELEGTQVFKQSRVPVNSDYVDAPDGYFIMSGSLGLTKKTGADQPLQIVLAVSNLTNCAYRDYMNRFRYFTDDPGRNWTLKVLIPFKLTTNKQEI